MIEKIVNILYRPQPEQTTGYNSVFRALDEKHEQLLTQPSSAELITVAQASPLACPVGDKLLKFCEEHGTVPTWVGMND